MHLGDARMMVSPYQVSCSNFNSGTVSWSSKKQSATALPTAEAEYIALSSGVQESIWLSDMLGCAFL